MKKKLLYAVCLMFALASCDGNDYLGWADPQTSEAEAAKTVELKLAPAAAIDLRTVAEDSVQLFIPTVTALDANVSTYDVVLKAEDGSMQTVKANNSGKVAVADLEPAYYALVGRQPVERTIELDVTGYTKINGQSIKNEGTTTATITANAPVLYSQYYIVGSVNGWNNADTSVPLGNGGADPYTTPTFNALIAAPADGSNVEFKVFPEESLGNWDAKNILSASAAGEEGKFSYANEGGNLVIPGDANAKFYRVTFNMLDGTWSYESLSFADRIYEIGNDSGWSSVQTLYGPNGDGKYTGYCYLNGEYKFKPNADNWDGDWEDNGNGTISENGAGNCPGVAPMYYKVDVDLAAMTYSSTALHIGILGDGAGGWDNDQDMTFNEAEKCYEITYTFTDGTFKFRANDGWDINWGGTTSNLTQGADNIPVTAGTHTVKFYLNNDGTATCTIK